MEDQTIFKRSTIKEKIMGVMSCSRKGCENVMCDRYSRDYGYICGECFQEMLETENFSTVKEFMNTKKNEKIGSDNSYENLNEIFETGE